MSEAAEETLTSQGLFILRRDFFRWNPVWSQSIEEDARVLCGFFSSGKSGWMGTRSFRKGGPVGVPYSSSSRSIPYSWGFVWRPLHLLGVAGPCCPELIFVAEFIRLLQPHVSLLSLTPDPWGPLTLSASWLPFPTLNGEESMTISQALYT